MNKVQTLPANIKFDRMQPEHLDQVLVIEKSSFPTPWTRQAFDYEIQINDFAHYIVALQDNRVAGYAGMWIILDEAHITNVAVHKKHRSRGLGKALMLEMIKRSVLLGAERMTLEVRPSNTTARHLYTRLGFAERGLRKKYYTDTEEDAIIMWKDDLVGMLTCNK
ncbi:ribosomal-protein-alanine N-acetyltransferase [Desulfoscipio geothermicus DSM 3669]|uniref:Ribosomal-protein-alanine N-acetyltransferase n=2 Tax=Desulfoscipio geothermicus TaxID=39060 RepID=A0A1I6DP87_9FIRM|nr:ribosomal-protein-alanine N-acetyltransferase [Desulfoscipio geothermicus DSM 3669]